MPIHEYECEVCRESIERLYLPGEKVPEEVVDYCPMGRTIATFIKVISRSSFRLLGTGWAYDGYSDRPWGKKSYAKAMSEDGYIPGSYIETGKAQFKEKGEEE
jgi:predicted nucleic acid-binding Zn ribbon protein